MKRLLLVTHRLPYPPDKGERVRAFNQIGALAKHFDIVLASLTRSRQDEESAVTLSKWCDEVIVAPAREASSLMRGAMSLIAGASVTEGYFSSPALRRQIRASSDRKGFDIVMGYSSSTLPYVLAAPAEVRVMDLVDVDSAKWAAYAREARWPKSWLYRREAEKVAALERRAVDRCDAVVLVSQAEADALACGETHVRAVTNGVDAEYFCPGVVGPASEDAGRMVFTGQMDYKPNVEGVCWFVREVWPQLKARCPDASFTIVGRNPSAAVERLADTDGIAVTGSVPDVRPYLEAADLAICPLRIARGIQNKVLEAMAMGKAVVASSPALEGLNVQGGTHVMSADEPEDWVDRICDLLGDKASRDALGSAARQHVLDKYTWSSAMAPLVEICNTLCGVSQNPVSRAVMSLIERAGQVPRGPV